MLKRKLLKKSAGLFLATILGFGVMPGQAEAKSSLLNDIIDIFTKPSSTTVQTRPSSNGDPMAKRVNLPLDGTYSSIYFPNGSFKHDAVVAEHYFELDRPAEVDLHFIGHTNRSFYHYVYDSDSNDLGGYVLNHDNATDKNIVLRPGRYIVKTKIYSSSSDDKNVDFEIKGIKHDIYPTVSSEGYRRYDANALYYNTEVVDYFPYATNSESNAKYYKFVLQGNLDVKIMLDKLSKDCNIVVHLLDEDESQIDYWYGIRGEHMEINKFLNAGTYYLKIKRSSNDGGAYSIKIK